MKPNFFEPYHFSPKGLTIKNRVVMAPMTTMSSFFDGSISNDEVDYYAERSGGPGMIITGVAYVTAEGKGFEGELSIAHDSTVRGLSKIAKAIQKDGTKAIIQIFHAGRKSNSKILRGVQPTSASAIAAVHPKDSEPPRELTNEEIEAIIHDFGQATRRAIQAGFDGVELHGANGYLLQQFFSAHSNRREDSWGGSFNNRMQFPLQVIKEVSSVIEAQADKPFLLGYRLSPEELEIPGIRLEDSLAFAQALTSTPVDYIHLSMGSYKRSSLNQREDKELILSKFVRVLNNAKPIIGVGSVERPEDAEAVIQAGSAFVGIGRELIREPKWVQKVQAGDLNSIRYQISPCEMDELRIPLAMQSYLEGSFREVIRFTTDAEPGENYEATLAPMEGFEKKL
ncbi:NADH-dependent flavin oxidoreductase [Paenibacillus sp. HN-1]|uniref:NADH-dependent flavin oxidoreductase n=1 Tax=Paenibacillus TaxID=44249 RepID=UPI001CA937B0|nr:MULTISPECIES: NADH-dependent flavin oxidoreductase [Paenibacillus]MBY9080211.1 NADH-dependent flavin oxidoreductase [Paenibacillus sp. CGMCC 1.18879]MBY9083130.1 NADH-dependent flavin oxidoreductase [Paenibacillus sinensis]